MKKFNFEVKLEITASNLDNAIEICEEFERGIDEVSLRPKEKIELAGVAGNEAKENKIE